MITTLAAVGQAKRKTLQEKRTHKKKMSLICLMLIPSPRQETCWRKVAYAQAKLSPFVATMQRVRLSMAREFESSLKKKQTGK